MGRVLDRIQDCIGSFVEGLISCFFIAAIAAFWVFDIGGIIHAARHHSTIETVVSITVPPYALFLGAESFWHEEVALADQGKPIGDIQPRTNEQRALIMETRNWPELSSDERDRLQIVFDRATRRPLSVEDVQLFRETGRNYKRRTNKEFFPSGMFDMLCQSFNMTLAIENETGMCLLETIHSGKLTKSERLNSLRSECRTLVVVGDRANLTKLLDVRIKETEATAAKRTWTDFDGQIRAPLTAKEVIQRMNHMAWRLMNLRALKEVIDAENGRVSQ